MALAKGTPVPRPPHRLRDGATARWRSLATLSLASILFRQARGVRLAIRHFTRSADQRSPVNLHSELGPRSLDPDRSFWSAFAELI